MVSDEEKVMASNPWDVKLESLPPSPTKIDGDQILYKISDILDNWPGVSTPVLSKMERHNRLLKTIAGYPDIEVATRPLDWTLHPKSINALSTSLAIDNLKGINPNTSLRSEILNLDYHQRNNPDFDTTDESDDKWNEVTQKCLALLFSKTNASEQSREALLASLFSYDNGEGLNGNWREAIEKIAKVPSYPVGYTRSSTIKPEKPTGEEKKIVGIAKSKKNINDIDPEIVEKVNKWNEYNDARNVEKMLKEYSLENSEYWIVTFQFYRIQTWLSSLLKLDKGTGTSQRVLRGASLAIESIISALRNVAIDLHGPGSIIIDGGGRLCVSVSSETKAHVLEKKLRKEYGTYLVVGHEAQKRLSRELECWFDALEIPRRRSGLLKQKLIREFTLCGLPPRSINISKNQFSSNNYGSMRTITSSKELISALNEWGSPPEVYSADGLYKDCPFLNEETSQEAKWNSVDHWVFRPASEMKEKYGIMVNNTHRLLYIAGHFQRMKDSVLHKPISNLKTTHVFEVTKCKDRRVIGLLKLDGNSIGHIFSQEKNVPNSLDVTRRRSFRFNVHWWSSLFRAIESVERNGGDKIGGWIVAGDDILLGEYGLSKEKSTSLVEVMKNLSKNISNSINLELNPNSESDKPHLTFAAGYCQRQEGDVLANMIRRVGEAEELAATIWKNIASVNFSYLLSEKKIKKIESDGRLPADEMKKGIEISADSKNLYVAAGPIKSSPNEENEIAEESLSINWPNQCVINSTEWDAELVEKNKKVIVDFIGRDVDFQELFDIMTRCEREIPYVNSGPDEELVVKKIVDFIGRGVDSQELFDIMTRCEREIPLQKSALINDSQTFNVNILIKE
jgi:hypothetical protein